PEEITRELSTVYGSGRVIEERLLRDAHAPAHRHVAGLPTDGRRYISESAYTHRPVGPRFGRRAPDASVCVIATSCAWLRAREALCNMSIVSECQASAAPPVPEVARRQDTVPRGAAPSRVAGGNA